MLCMQLKMSLLQIKHLKITAYIAKGLKGNRQIYGCYKVLFIVLNSLNYLNRQILPLTE